ncbi:MAG: FecR domain-containing protein [Bacteroidota bacterium]
MSNWTLIGKYLSGNSTDEEKEQLEKKLILDSTFKADFEKAKIIWEASTEKPFIIPDTEKEWIRLKSRIESQSDGLTERKDYRRLRKLAWRLPVAASLIAFSFYMGTLSNERDYQTIGSGAMVSEKVLTKLRQEIEERENKFFEVFATSEEKAVFLPDSSYVVLSPGSHLKYDSTTFGIEQRLVHLEGEAFFDVKRDTTRLFEIFAQGTRTKVLGTSFNLRAYETEDSVMLLVTSGHVTFDAEQIETKALVKDDYLTYHKIKRAYAINNISLKEAKKPIEKKTKALSANNRKKPRLNIKDSLYLSYTPFKRGNKRFTFTGTIQNNSKLYSAGNIQIKYRFYNKETGEVSTLRVPLSDDIKPGSKIEFKDNFKGRWVAGADSVSAEIIKASETSVYEKRDE